MLSIKKLLLPIIVLSLLVLLIIYLFTSDTGNFIFFLLLGLFLLSLSILYCRQKWGKVPFWKGRLRRVGLVLIWIGVSFYLLFSAILLWYGWSRPYEKADYLIVLGAGLIKDQPSKVLANRLERALIFSQNNPTSTIILCGGQGRRETISEALGMKKWLVNKGIASNRILLEDKSRSTFENLSNAASILLGQGKNISTLKTAVLTSDFHLLRAGIFARSFGFRPLLIPAASPWYLLPSYLFREQLAMIKALFF